MAGNYKIVSFLFFPQRCEDTPVLLTKNEIKAAKKLVFSVVWKTLKIAMVRGADFDGCDVDLYSVRVWTILGSSTFIHVKTNKTRSSTSSLMDIFLEVNCFIINMC